MDGYELRGVSRRLLCQITMYDYMDFDEFLQFMTHYDARHLVDDESSPPSTDLVSPTKLAAC